MGNLTSGGDGTGKFEGPGEGNDQGKNNEGKNGEGKNKKVKKRHLVRMRIRNEEMGWQLPDELKGAWEEAFGGHGVEPVWHLEPMPEGYFPLRKYPL
jgi:hypothetical protein